MVREDHPSNTIRGAGCLYDKDQLPIIRRDISNLKECLVTEITVKNKRCLLRSLYRSPSLNREHSQFFCDSLDIPMRDINSLNPAISIITGDFNGKCSKWYSFDTSDNLRNLIPLNLPVFTQMFGKPTHFKNHSSSCIDRIFTSNHSIMVDLGIERSLCGSYHHDILFIEKTTYE